MACCIWWVLEIKRTSITRWKLDVRVLVLHNRLVTELEIKRTSIARLKLKNIEITIRTVIMLEIKRTSIARLKLPVIRLEERKKGDS